jgi:hypothetical protein
MNVFYYFDILYDDQQYTDRHLESQSEYDINTSHDDEIKFNISENNMFELMMISNCLIQQYDIWKNNKDIILLLQSNSNIIKNKLFNSYENIDEQTLNCISLSFYLYLYFSIMKNCQVI